MKKYAYDGQFNLVDNDGNKYLLTVERYDFPEDPRDQYNISTIWCWHRNYGIGDIVPNKMSFTDSIEYLCGKYTDMTEDEIYDASGSVLLNKLHESDNIILVPITCYEHGGITISTEVGIYPYNDRWDAGVIGFAFVDKDKIINECCVKEECWKDEAKKIIDGEVETLDQYLRGDVYRYTLEQQVHYRNETKCPHCGEVISVDEGDDWEEVDSCCGFYGDDMEENGIMDYLSGYTFVD